MQNRYQSSNKGLNNKLKFKLFVSWRMKHKTITKYLNLIYALLFFITGLIIWNTNLDNRNQNKETLPIVIKTSQDSIQEIFNQFLSYSGQDSLKSVFFLDVLGKKGYKQFYAQYVSDNNRFVDTINLSYIKKKDSSITISRDSLGSVGYSKDEIDSVVTEKATYQYLTNYLKPVTIGAAGYKSYATLNSLNPDELRDILRQNGVNQKYIDRVPTKFSKRWLARISKGRKASVFLMGAAAAYGILEASTSEVNTDKVQNQDLDDSQYSFRYLLVILCGSLFCYQIYLFLVKIRVLQ